jgi:hypothetical protein
MYRSLVVDLAEGFLKCSHRAVVLSTNAKEQYLIVVEGVYSLRMLGECKGVDDETRCPRLDKL